MITKIIDFSVRFKFFILGIIFFLAIASLYALYHTPIDALPDISPVQTILQVDYEGQSPKIIDEQVNFLLTSTLMSIPNVEVVRGMSSFGKGLVYVIFKDRTNIYWANNRILEKITALLPSLPKEAKITLGTDTSGIGWAFMYAISSKTKTLQELRALQDFYYKYHLLEIDGVSEVASIGGFEKNYEIRIDAKKLLLYDLDFDEIVKRVKQSNNDSGGGVVLQSGFEKIVSANGYLKNQKDIKNIMIKMIDGIPLKISDIANVYPTPAYRRGIADLNGNGEVVGGIVLMRYGSDTFGAIKTIKKRLSQIQEQNPDIKITPVYDRSLLIQEAIDNLWHTLFEECVIVLIIVMLFLWHLRSVLVMIITIPLCVLFSFLLMKIFGITSNIMSLGGIAIAIGAMVDAAIVMVENAHKHLLLLPTAYKEKDRIKAIVNASSQVGGAVFFALIIITISFLPIFGLGAQEGKLFTPLAFTKTFAMIFGAFLSITLVPILMIFFLKGRFISEENNILSKFFILLYTPLLKVILKFRYLFLGVCIFGIGYVGYLYQYQKWEFMPPLDEGVIVYMPVTNYGVNVEQAKEFLVKSNKILKSFPEVDQVFGKVGSANTPTDPAPLAMIETFITLKPKREWREGMSMQKLRHSFEDALQIKGLTNSWTYPIKGRIDMLLTGIRTPLGIKVFGNDIEVLQKISNEIESRLKHYQGSLSVFAQHNNQGYFIDITLDNKQLAFYGVSKEKVLNFIAQGIGGAKISTIINGVERYGLSLRLDSTQRNSLEAIKNIYIKTNSWFVPLGDIAKITQKEMPVEINSEGGLKVNFIYITPKDNVTSDTYKKEAMKLLKDLKIPNGYYYKFSGESEYLEQSLQTMRLIIPLTILLIFILILIALQNFIYTIVVFVALPFAILGGLFAIDLLNYNLSIAVIVGFLALLGISAETSIVMMIYLDQALRDREEKDLKQCIIEGAAKRVRPKLMTVLSLVCSLLPIMFNDGAGHEVMRRIALPILGGIITSMISTLLIIPVCLYILQGYKEKKKN